MHYIYITTINTDKWRARNEPNYQKELFWHFFVASFRALLLISKGINLTFIIFIFENCQFRRRTIMNAFIRAIRNIETEQKKWKKKKWKKVSKSINNYDRSPQLFFVILSEEQLVPDRLDRWHFFYLFSPLFVFTFSCSSSVHSAPFDFNILR